MVMHTILKYVHHWAILLALFYIPLFFLTVGAYNSESVVFGKRVEDLLTGFHGEKYRGHTFGHIGSSTLPPSFGKTSASCEDDLKGVGSLNTTCRLNSSLYFNDDIYIFGLGNLEILPHVALVCSVPGCSININISGNVKLGKYSVVIASTVVINATNVSLEHSSSLNTTAQGASPPPQTSGTPLGPDGAGGGHGGRGALCLKGNHKSQEDVWGGDVYAWSTLSDPWSYGSKGGTTSALEHFGGNGGGRVMINVKEIVEVNGSVTAEGGEGGLKGGGGSGGSIIIYAFKLKGTGTVSAAGGRGWGGGGGGRISLHCYSMQEDVGVLVHGGESIGCPGNAGAAGTIFDALLLSLRVSNCNVTTQTETPLLDFSTSPPWSNVFVESHAKAVVPLLWTRVQVRSQIRLLYEGSLSFGLADYPFSEFELVAEELLLSDSTIKVYGAFRMSVKMLLMWNSKIQIDGGSDSSVGASSLEARNLIVLRENSVISSNAVLGLFGQGLLRLSGHGDAIKGQRLFLSLFYNITVGRGSLLQAPLDDEFGKSLESNCESRSCPEEIINPPDDCHVNSSSSFTLQICRVEDLTVSGLVKGSILHIHRARTVVIEPSGMISASELGCLEGIGKGKFLKYGAGGGGGHGGSGGAGYYNGKFSEGGPEYGDANLPCELGSGSGGPSELDGQVAGGGMIAMGSTQWPLSKLSIHGTLKADGQSCGKPRHNNNGTVVGGIGGGSGGTILLFLQALKLGYNSTLSVVGGNGGPIGGGGGGGGRIHFDWSNIATGDEYVPIAILNGTIYTRGGNGSDDGHCGNDGTMTGKRCPKGRYGTFCVECPIGTYKDVVGSDPSLCIPCPLEFLPNRAAFVYVRGGVSQSTCPYKCLSDKYRMPNCYTPLEELIYAFGGPWLFGLVLSFVLVLLALILSAVRIKVVASDRSYGSPTSMESQVHNTFPYLLSLAEVRETNRAEETHVHRMYFMGPNTFREPWHLPHSPPDAIIDIVYEDAFNRFIDEINSVAAYEWWEGSVHSILCLVAYPCAWSWKQWRRRNKICRLQEFVKSEYDHSCLRSCRSRALYKGMKVGSTPDLMVAYIDFFLGGDEKRHDLAPVLQHRFPMSIIFGGDGSYMSPYYLHSDLLLTNLLGQYVPTAEWNRLVAGLNAHLRTVKQGCIRSDLVPVINWINSLGNPQLEFHSMRIEMGWFQATASGYYQLGLFVVMGFGVTHSSQNSDFFLSTSSHDQQRSRNAFASKKVNQLQQNQPFASGILSHKRLSGGIINEGTLQSLDYRRDILFPFSLLLCNTRPVGHQDTLVLLISILLLGDFSLTLLTLLEFYWISLGAFLAVLLVLPLSLLSPFPAGLNALFSHIPRRSTSLARVYALWSATSLSNVLVAFICGIVHYGLPYGASGDSNAWNFKRDGDKWWVLPLVLLLVKCAQARLLNMHIANLEIQDPMLFTEDPARFWGS
ncbi:hypothetical protein AMTRI_Chr03g51930 [Amborella trichopoda]